MVYIKYRTPDPFLLVSTGAFPESVLCTSPPCRGLPVDLLRSSGVPPPRPMIFYSDLRDMLPKIIKKIPTMISPPIINKTGSTFLPGDELF